METDGDQAARGRWWLEPEVGLLILLAFGLFFSRMTVLSIRGEESRRAQVAAEMIASGDWIVPHQQGEIYLSRPPLGNWAIALAALAVGEVNPLSARLPSALATLATVLLVYGYARNFCSRAGALGAAAAFATMGQVMELGYLAETEAVLTFLLASSLLVWHAGYMLRWPMAVTWMAGYGLAALAGLTKGPQGPVYFVAVVGAYLIWMRDWRFLFSWAHGAGLALFGAVVAAWQIPFLLELDGPSVATIWGNNAAARFVDSTALSVAEQLATFPLEVLACMLPWSVLLIGYGDRKLRASIGPARGYVVFLVIAVAVTFPTCWLATEGRSRYFMPLYPCFACLIGLVIDRSLASAALAKVWNRFLKFMVYAMLASAGVVLVMSQPAWIADLVPPQPVGFACAYAVLTLAAAAMAWRAARQNSGWRAQAGVLSVALFLGLSYTGAVTNALVASSVDAAEDVARIRDVLPPDARLVSLGRVHHLFAFHYREPIPLIQPDRQNAASSPAYTYFCFHQIGNAHPPLPAQWEPIGVVSCERNRRDDPWDKVVVGRVMNRSGTAARERDAARR